MFLLFAFAINILFCFLNISTYEANGCFANLIVGVLNAGSAGALFTAIVIDLNEAR